MAQHEIVTVLSGRETISPAAKKAGQAVKGLGDDLGTAAKKAGELDAAASKAETSTDELSGELKDAARQAAELAAAAEAAGEAVEELGDDMADAAHDAARLEQQLADAREEMTRLAAEFSKTGDKTLFKDIRIQERQIREVTKIQKIMSESGSAGAEQFSMSFAARLGPLLARAPISPPLLLAVGAAAPALGAAVSAGVLAGLSGGAVAAGLSIAFKDPAVKAEASDLGKYVGAELNEAASAFRPAAIAAIRHVRSEFGQMRGDLKDAFDVSAGFVMPLTRGVSALVRNALPGIASALQKSAPVVAALEHGLAGVGEAAGDALDTIADGATGAAVFVADLLNTVQLGMRATAEVVGFLSKAYALVRAAAAPNKATFAAEAAMGQAKAAEFAEEAKRLAGSLRETAGGAKSAATEVKSLTERMREHQQQVLSAFDAETRFEEAIDQATAATHRNSAGLDKNSERGRSNRDALSRLATATTALYHQQVALTGTQGRAAAIMARGYTMFMASAKAMGVTRAQADALARSLGLIPHVIPVKVHIQTIGRIPSSIHTSASTGAAIKGQRHYDGRASGGPVSAGRTYLVGEQGPELVRFSAPGHVFDAGKTKQMLGKRGFSPGAGAAGGGPVQVVVTPKPGMERGLMRALVEALRYEVRVSGRGSVQTLLGAA